MFLGVMPTILRPSLLSAILKPQDVFATSLYTGNALDRVVSTGFKPDLMWNKQRNAAANHILADTVRGTNALFTNDTAAEQNFGANSMTSQISGVGIAAGAGINVNGNTHAIFAFARAAKFFDIVTWTGDGTSNRQIPHGLGVVPGMVIVKSRSGTQEWAVYHRALTNSKVLFLNSTQAAATTSALFPSEPTSLAITVGASGEVNSNNLQYVAYLFAHDASADGIVQCGSFTGGNAITLGWMPQFVMIKRTDASADWIILDTSRGWGAGADAMLAANLSAAEDASLNYGAPTSTGFTASVAAGASFIYLAIRAAY